MINYEFPPIGGGAANAHKYILREFAKLLGLEVDVLTSAAGPGFVEESFAENINLYKVGLHKKELHYWRKSEVIEWLMKARGPYRRMIKQNKYDLVHSFFAFPSGYLCYKTAGQLPYIVSLRGSDTPGYNVRLGLDYKLLAGLFRRIWSSASAVVANSRGLRQLALQFMPTLEISVIPNGVDTERFCPAENKVVGKQVKLLTVSRLISRKRIDLIIETVGRLRTKGLDVTLNIAGEGNLLSELTQLVNGLKITDSVSFLGRISPDRMPAVYRDNDIFVMSSQHEGMSNAILEAMASGLPIVTTRCEGVNELVNGNGVVVEQENPTAIAEAVEKLVSDVSLYGKMCAASREKATGLTWSSVASQYTRLYELVLQNRCHETQD
jgi:glycosyltransferase involved in cell wall biosynthesis